MSESETGPSVVDSPTGWVNDHIREYVESGGENGHDWQGTQTALLTTIGRKSGQRRRTALIYGTDGDAYYVVASYGGAPDHPLWYHNLQANPAAELQVGADSFAVRARTATDQERARLWPDAVRLWPPYDEYQTKTDRQIPIVLLERV